MIPLVNLARTSEQVWTVGETQKAKVVARVTLAASSRTKGGSILFPGTRSKSNGTDAMEGKFGPYVHLR